MQCIRRPTPYTNSVHKMIWKERRKFVSLKMGRKVEEQLRSVSLLKGYALESVH